MGVSPGYREFVLEQFSRVAPVTARSMFGGVGLYSGGVFFGLIDDDTLFLKVDDSSRSDFEAHGMRPFTPYGDRASMRQYYEVPAAALEDPEALGVWLKKALAAARRKQGKRRSPRPRGSR